MEMKKKLLVRESRGVNDMRYVLTAPERVFFTCAHGRHAAIRVVGV